MTPVPVFNEISVPAEISTCVNTTLQPTVIFVVWAADLEPRIKLACKNVDTYPAVPRPMTVDVN